MKERIENFNIHFRQSDSYSTYDRWLAEESYILSALMNLDPKELEVLPTYCNGQYFIQQINLKNEISRLHQHNQPK